MFVYIKKTWIFICHFFSFKRNEFWYLTYDKCRKISEIEDSLALLLKNHESKINGDETKIAILVHLFYIEMWKEFSHYLINVERPFDLYVNLVEGSSSNRRLIRVKQEILRKYPTATVIISGNRGLDIGGTLALINLIIEKRLAYDLFLKIHSKKSHRSTTKIIGRRWRQELLNSMMGSAIIVNGIITLFKKDERIGMVGPKTWHIKAGDNYNFAVGTNESAIKEICKLFEITEDISSLEFIGGTMFWIDARIILNKMKKVNLQEIISNLEAGYFRDNHQSTKTHSLERVFGLIILDEKREIVAI